jgi:hypothetical protein
LAGKGDVAGSKDYPGIRRFAGSVITGYEVKDFDTTQRQAATLKDGRASDERKPGRARYAHRLQDRAWSLGRGSIAQFRNPAQKGWL